MRRSLVVLWLSLVACRLARPRVLRLRRRLVGRLARPRALRQLRLRVVVCSRWRFPGADGSTAAGASSRASSAISSTRHYCRRRKRLVLGPLGLGNARRWFAVRKAQGPELALGAAASVRLAGFWLALACGRSRSCPLMVARADARSAGHGRTMHSTKLAYLEGERASKSVSTPSASL